jgi:hypothetical protein
MTDLLNDAPAAPNADAVAAAAAAAPAKQEGDAPPAAGSGEKTWLDGLPDDLKASPSLTRYSSQEALARAYLNAEKMIGSEKVPIPKDPNDAEAWDRYYKAGGRPEDPAKYEFQKPEKMPEGTTYDEGMETWWRQSAHEAGLSQRQASKLFERYRDRFLSSIELSEKASTTEVQNAKLALERDWGGEFKARRQLAKAAFAEMPADLQAAMSRAGLVRMPSFVKYLHDMKAKTTGETDPKIGGRATDGTPDAVKASIAKHREQYAGALMDTSHPEHDLRTRELTAMHEKLFAESVA